MRQVLSYDKENGVFSWKQRLSNRTKVGDYAGSFINGYVEISIDGSKYLAHHLVILEITGKLPKLQVDHMNGVTWFNTPGNVREADYFLNAQNRRTCSKNNVLKTLGVAFCKQTRRYRTQIMADKKKISLGRFDTLEAASNAYLKAKRLLHKGNTL